jgi:hypothetical protein
MHSRHDQSAPAGMSFMVCAEGLRVWRSCRNAVNHPGNGSVSGRG